LKKRIALRSMLAAAFITIAVISFNIIATAQVIRVFLYLTGTLFYILFIHTSRIEYSSCTDYFQSGNGAITILLIILCSRFLSDNIYVILVTTLAVTTVLNFFKEMIIERNRDELFAVGLIVNIITALIIIFLYLNDKLFPSAIIPEILTGYLHSADPGIYHFIIIYVTYLIMAIVYVMIKPELQLLSHGPDFFFITGYNKKILSLTMLIMKNITFIMTFFLLGALGGAGYYLFINRNNTTQRITPSILVILYTQILLAGSQIINSYTIFALTLSISYALYFFTNKKESNIYDINI